MAKDFEGKYDSDIFKKITSDDFMCFDVIEFYETLNDILQSLFKEKEDQKIVEHIVEELRESIDQRRFLTEFRMSGLPLLNDKLEKLLYLLNKDDYEDLDLYRSQLINVLQDIMEINNS